MKDNIYKLSIQQFAAIEALTPAQLATVRCNIRALEYTDDETRDAVGLYVADGGLIEDLLNGGIA